MKKLYLFIITAIMLSSCSDITNSGIDSQDTSAKNLNNTESASSVQTDSDVWVGAYLASYNHFVQPTGNWGNLPTEEIDWDAFTHLFYFALNAKADGSLSAIEPYQNMSPDRINSAVTAAHNAGKPVLFTIGGWGNYDGFSNAIKPANRAVFISNIIATMQTWGFDGVDLDMEPIKSGDVDNYIALVNELHTALQAVDVPMLSSDPLLTTAVGGWHSDMFAQIHDKFDQINLMTYDYSGAWQGWESWHNAAVSNGGRNFASNGKPLPSIEESVKSFTNAGVPASKLGIGIDFYGYVWSGGSGTSTGGVTKPNQSWSTAPTVTDNVPYHKIMDQYFQSGTYHWDDQAKAAYLSIDNSGSTNDKFISYDDERSIEAKFDYIRQQGLGGTIIWELTGGYRENKPAGERDNLLQAVKNQINNGGGSTGPVADTEKPSVSIDSPYDGETVSGTTNIDLQSSDNVGVSSMELIIDGTSVNNSNSSAYSYSWDTKNHPNHTCIIEARAVDAAGNTSSTSASVTIHNSTTDDNTGDNTGTISSGTKIYEESLNSPWINTSWSATVDFNNAENTFGGSSAIKVSQGSWGALSLRSGSWSKGQDVDPAQYEAIELAVYAYNQDAKFSLMLENDQGYKFPRVSHGTVSANRWTTIRIPLSELNPGGEIFHRIDVLETSGSSKTYYVDDITLVGDGSGSDSDSGTGDSGSGDSGTGDTGSDTSTDTYVNIFTEQLESPWINTSWSATVDFNNAENTFDGSSAIKVKQGSWGALSLRSGSWSKGQDVDPAQYEAIELAVYASNQDAKFSLMLENDQGYKFPRVSHGSVSANRWTTIRIPLSELNPGGEIFHRIDVLETSGSSKTYYVDNLRLVQ